MHYLTLGRPIRNAFGPSNQVLLNLNMNFATTSCRFLKKTIQTFLGTINQLCKMKPLWNVSVANINVINVTLTLTLTVPPAI